MKCRQRRLLQAAVMAPSAHNRQPWRLTLLQDRAIKLALADAMGRRLRQDRSNDGDDPASIETDVARSRSRIAASPVAPLLSFDVDDPADYREWQLNIRPGLVEYGA
jgi:coenzyme F420-0:L-glutamate ligase / coenzyme F420-1:gamma-L-glutamate ligase